MKKKKYNFTYDDLKNSLIKTGLKKKDSIFLTTSLGNLGVPFTKNKNFILIISRWLKKSIEEIIGKNGNIFVPTYSYTFSGKKKFFYTKKTKAKIGYFPNFFLKQKRVFRSHDPMMSIAGTGPNAKNILNNISNSSFGKNSVFEKLLNIRNLKCCTIGLSYNWIPFLHYLDWRNDAPFRFDKIFEGYINNKRKKWIFFARHLRKETVSNGYKLGYRALKNKLYSKSIIGKSQIFVINYENFFYFAKRLTKNNKWLTVNGPKFKTKN